MKLTKVRLIGANTIDLPLEGVGPLTPYMLKAADGLGPTEVDVLISRTLLSGGVYQGRRPQLREVTIRIGLQPEWNIGQTAQELRTELYGLLTPRYGEMVKLQIIDGEDVIAETSGHVRRLEIAPFSKDPEVQVVLSCLESYLTGPDDLTFNPTWVDGPTMSSVIIDNPGTAPTGFYAEILFQTNFTGFINLTDAAGLLGERIYVEQDFNIGDTFVVDTREGSRGVWRKRNGFSTLDSILGGMGPNSVWLQLYHGENTLRVNHLGVDWGAAGLKLKPLYWGI